MQVDWFVQCASDVLAGCDAAANYCRAVLDNYFFWKQTWLDEGKMTLKLPERNDTNGHLLQMQVANISFEATCLI